MNSLFSLIYTKKYINKMEEMVKSLGCQSKINLDYFFLSRVIIEVIMFFFLLLIPKYGLIISIVCSVGFHFLYELFVIRYRVYYRTKEINLDAKYFFQLFRLGLESDNNMDKVLVTLMDSIDDLFTIELKKASKSGNYKTTFKAVIDRIPAGRVKELLKDILLCESKYEVVNVIDEYLKVENDISSTNSDHYIHILPIKVILLIILFLILTISIIIFIPRFL